MKNKKFWKWNVKNEESEERTLFLNGIIAEESWFDDDVTPQIFKDELLSGTGNITVYINSYGGDCVAAARIYNMLTEYNGRVTVKIDGVAASAASVVAMAGDKVLMSPTSTIMVHNPATSAWGDHTVMQKALDMLNEFKEAIINAYQIKTGLSRAKLSRLMEDETWMNANKAIELGFADGIIGQETSNFVENTSAMMFSYRTAEKTLLNKIEARYNSGEIHDNKTKVPKDSDISEDNTKTMKDHIDSEKIHENKAEMPKVSDTLKSSKPHDKPAKNEETAKEIHGHSVDAITEKLTFIKKFI